MIKLIYGIKGSGKTQKMIELANDVVQKNNVCVISDVEKYVFEIKNKIQVFNALNCFISNEENLFGFISGVICSNEKADFVFIDGIARIVNLSILQMQNFFEKLIALSNAKQVEIILTISANYEDLPDFLRALV